METPIYRVRQEKTKICVVKPAIWAYKRGIDFVEIFMSLK